jgi:hypothetical protein
MVGILVCGNNHFILSGPPPDEAAALALARHLSVVQIGAPPPSTFGPWQIRNKEFRENLEWAVVVSDTHETSAPVAQLLSELTARGIHVLQCRPSCC